MNARKNIISLATMNGEAETEIFNDKVTWSIFKSDVKEKLVSTNVFVFNTQLDKSGNIAIIEIMMTKEIIYIFRIDLIGYIPKFILKALENPYIMKVGFNLYEEERRFKQNGRGWPINT